MKRKQNKPYLTPQVEVTDCDVVGLLANSLKVYDKPSDPNEEVLCNEEMYDFPWDED